MTDLLIAAALLLIGILWADGMKALERANLCAREVCARANLSLLDDTVVLNGRQWIRSVGGRWVLRRTYTFDYSVDACSRASGFIILQGYRLASCGLAPDVGGDDSHQHHVDGESRDEG